MRSSILMMKTLLNDPSIKLEEGLFVGMSSGAAMVIAVEKAAE
ncbi:MAG: hypothetical protein R2874_01665 [Desulfobacterales bacterium]